MATEDTELNVVSLSGAPISVTVRLFGADGEVAPPYTGSLQVAGALQAAASVMFPGAGPSWLSVGLGGQFTMSSLTAQLKTVYGDHPSTAVVFLRLRPKGNMTGHMRQMHGR